MYRQVETDREAFTTQGGRFVPAATLKDQFGGKAHIALDDRCYVLYLQAKSPCPDGCLDTVVDRYALSPYWFEEAVRVLQTLLPPK